MEEKVSVPMTQELKEKIDRRRAEIAAETGEIPPRTVYIREAIRARLGIDYETDLAESEKGAA